MGHATGWVLGRILACALLSWSLYLLLPEAAGGLASSEPSFAGEVLPGVQLLDREGLTAAQQRLEFPAASARFLSVYGALFAAYIAALLLVRGRQPRRVTTVLYAAGALFLALQVFSPIMMSTDVFAYILYGRVPAIYGANPYSLAPPVPADDPYLLLYGLGYLPSWYGPLWTLLSSLLARVGGVQVGLTVLLFKGVTLASALLAGALVWDILRRIAPERVSQGVAVLLWNPLFVMETGLSGHNDAVMLALVLLAVRLHLAGWRLGAVSALTLSALIKFLTGMLIPLYVWMVLRQGGTWRARASFAVRAGLVAGAVWLGAERWSGEGEGAPVGPQAVAPDFYLNNFHELVFKALRRGLGEDAELTQLPIYFQGWWIAAAQPQMLRSSPMADGAVIRKLNAEEPVLVCAPQMSDWARVYDLRTRGRGYVDAGVFGDAQRPAAADADGQALLHERMVLDWPTVHRANAVLRVTAWLAFGLFGLAVAWRTRDLESFLVGSTVALLASYYLIITEIWPWYANWALAVGALVSHRRPAQFAVLLTACVPTLYVTMDFQGSAWAWLHTFRSLPAFLLPLGAFFLYHKRFAFCR